MPDFSRYAIDCYLGELTNSAADFQGFYPALEIESFTPGRETEDPTTIKSKRRDTYGQNVYSEANAGSINVTIEIKEQPTWILALAFSGTLSDDNVVGASVTDEIITVHALDRKYKLAQRNLDDQSAVTVTGPSGTPTYTATTDYTIDYRTGMITMISGGPGGFSAGGNIEVDYTYLTATRQKILGEKVTSKPFQIFLDMVNRVSGKDAQVVYHQVNLTAPDVFDLASEEFITVTLEGEAITPAGKTSPYEYLHIDSPLPE